MLFVFMTGDREPREELRKLLCPDVFLNKAIILLERLSKLPQETRNNWHSPYAIGVKDRVDEDILLRLCAGGFVGSVMVAGTESYCLSNKGKEFYFQLTQTPAVT